jgi:hypothetical protein
MAPQHFSWNCAACALDWVLRSTRLAPETHTPFDAQREIGYPHNINPQYGLMSGDGRAVREVYSDYGQNTRQAWLDFDSVYELAQVTTGQMSGSNWYHWVSLRGVSGNALWIANSAPGFRGVFSVLSRQDFERLGSFSVVWLAED